MIGLMVMLLGCQTEEKESPPPQWASADLWKDWHNCSELLCRSTVMATQFSKDKTLVPKWMNLIAEPEEQMLQLNKLLTAHPGKIQDLCASFQLTQIQKKCSSSAARPHLYTQGKSPKVKKIPKRRASGSGSSQMFLPIVRDSPLMEGTPKREVCASDADPRSCLHRKALQAAQKRDSLLASQYCRAISRTHIRWRWECHFKVAEVFISNHEGEYETAAEHCFLAKEYSGRCIIGLHHRLSERVPSADSNAKAWSATLHTWSTIEAYWSKRSKKESLRLEIRDSFWGIILLKAYQKAEKITGDPLDALPEYTHPHIYAAAAFKLIHQHREVYTLEELRAKLTKAVQKREAREMDGNKKESRVISIDDLWMRDKEEDVDIPAIGYLGRSRRTFSENKEEDLSICLLEAAARKGGYWLELVEKERESEQERLRWTARRLLKPNR